MSDVAHDLYGLAIGMASPSLARETVTRGAQEIERLRATIADLTAALRAIDDGWEGGKLPMFLTEMVRAALARAKGE